ncbi:hypothetical protein [Sphaerisporangium sp. TRM90804]|uniref:hypothetical protein n=1 Tax=Sphaerisporangium sp. TRM90804 TaxID=3031113 RepID=UPI0024476823|nr:hypothetical protein [Sphaerisporangium sp. TRM90804]MDH2425808.1 hypothetical protein [Sphaerisporangium sp. TRM90804]
MAATKQQRPPADWSLETRGNVSATATGMLAVAAGAVAAHTFQVEPEWIALGALPAVLGSIVRSTRKAATTPALLFRMLRVIGAGGWATYAVATGPWDRYTLLALGIAGVSSGALAPLFETGPRATGHSRALVLRRTTRLAQDWEARILRVAKLAVRIEEVSYWDTGAGFTLYGVLPLGGATRAQLAAHSDSLAADARLPDGCTVEVTKGRHRGGFTLHVSTVNRLTEDIAWPEDLQMRPITEPKQLGEHRDSTPVLVNLRQACVIVTGQTGSGKTTTLNGLIWRGGMCPDSLVTIMDMNGGGLAHAWLRTWLEGVTDRPAIDWAAGDPEEGLALSQWLVDVCHDRKTTYAHLKIDADLTLQPVSADVPAIICVVDEGGEVLSPTTRDPVKAKIRDNLEEVQRIGRDVGVRLIIASLRATQDMVAANIVKQSTVRIGMFVQDEAELNYLFGWRLPYGLEDLHGPGTGFVQTLETPLRPWKAGNVKPSMIRRAAIHIANHRTDLDAAGVAVGGRVYAERLERMRARFTVETAVPAVPAGLPVPAGPDPRTAPAPQDGPRRLVVLRGGAADWPDPAEIAAAARAAGPSFAGRYNLEPDRQDPPLRAEQVQTLPAPAGDPLASLGNLQDLPPVLRLSLNAMDDADDVRMHSEDLAAALGLPKRELGLLLREIGVRPLSAPFERNGRPRRGYDIRDLHLAALRIREGLQDVPQAVAQWSA